MLLLLLLFSINKLNLSLQWLLIFYCRTIFFLLRKESNAMSEGKRIQLTSMTATGTSPLPIATSGGALLPPATSISGTLIGSSGANSGPSGHTTSAGNRLSSDFLPQAAKVMDKTNNSSSKSSTRLTIELFQSDSSKYPEFNYTRLLRLEKVIIK